MKGRARSRVLIVDDHPFVRRALSELVDRQPDLRACGVAGDPGEALRRIEGARPHIVLVDIVLGDANGLDLVKTIKERYPAIRTLVVSMHESRPFAKRALEAGAKGFVSKREAPRRLTEAIRAALSDTSSEEGNAPL